jgi:hypothetical protein
LFRRCIIFKPTLSKLAALFVGLYILCGAAYASSKTIVAVQAGDHSDFVRLSLTWPQPINFDYVRKPTGFEIRFFQKAELLLDRLISIFPGSSYRQDGNQTVLSINVSPKRNFIAKSYGNITYLDVYKDGVQEIKLVPHPGIKASHSVVDKKKVETKTTEIDLQNLFRKVADYLGELKPDMGATVTSYGDNGILLKYQDAPIAVYENEKKICIVILKDEYPILEKQLEEKYSVQLLKLNGAFVLQIGLKDFLNPIVSKDPNGWRIEFKRALLNGSNPQFFIRDGAAKIKMNRSGLFDPIDVNGVSVFCTLSPDVFVPMQLEDDRVHVFATSAGAAFKVGVPETIEVDRDFITLLFEAGVLPQDKLRKIDFSQLDAVGPFSSCKQKLLDAMISVDGNGIQKHIDLILLYLSKGFGGEAASEVEALSQESSGVDPGVLTLLGGVAGIVDGVLETEGVNKLFSLHKMDLETAAWCAFSLAQLEQVVIPYYLAEFLFHSINVFPEPLRSLLFVSFADRLILQNDIDLAEIIIQKINEDRLSSESVLLKQFLYAKIRKVKYKQDDAEEFKRLLRQTQDPLLEARIIIESGLIDWKKKDHLSYIETLEMVLPLISGSSYHLEALDYLFSYHIGVGNYLQALELGILYKKAHPQAYSKIKLKTQTLMYDLVREKAFENNGLIFKLQLLTEFVDDLPSSGHVADTILDLTQKLERIGLLEESIHLIERYIRRADVRLNLKKQQEVFFQLLDFYIKNESVAKAKDLIVMIEKSGELTKENMERAQVYKARLSLLRNKPDEALVFLQLNHSLEGLKIKSSLLWGRENWSGAADALEELIDTHGKQLDSERRERYIVHLAAALVLNEEKYRSKNVGRQKTRVTLQGVLQKYEGVMSKYKVLLDDLTTEPYNSMLDALSRQVIINETNETDKIESLFNQLKAVPTN